MHIPAAALAARLALSRALPSAKCFSHFVRPDAAWPAHFEHSPKSLWVFAHFAPLRVWLSAHGKHNTRSGAASREQH